VGEVDKNIPGQSSRCRIRHRPTLFLLKYCQGNGIDNSGISRALRIGHVDEPPITVEDPYLFECRVQPHQVFFERLVLWIKPISLNRTADEPQFEEVAVIRGGHVSVFPQPSARRLRQDSVRDKRIAEPDLRYPVVEGGEPPEIEAEVRRVGGVLDGA